MPPDTSPQWNRAVTGTKRTFARPDFTPDILTCGGPHLIATGEAEMGFIKSGLLWLVGIPLPFILLLALFLHPG